MNDTVDIGQLAKQSGLDTTRCEFCDQPLDDHEPWRRGLDGMGAHERCLRIWIREGEM